MTEQVTDSGSTNTDTGSASEVNVDSGSVLAGEAGSTDTGESSTGDQPSVEEGSNVETDDNSVPEAYSYTPPEGSEVDADLLEYATPVLKEAGVTKAQAEKLLRGLAEREDALYAQEQQEVVETAKQWEGDLRKDPEFGGEKFDENVGQIRDFMEAVVPQEIKEELYEFFNDTGFGSHPALVKFIHTMAQKFPVSEDTPLRGDGGNVQRSKSVEQRMYGTD